MTEFVLGIDWGSKCHAVCVVDAHGEVVLEEEVAHRGADVLAFVERLFDVVGGDAARVSAAMEAPHGVMVEVLLERGVDCYSINPKQLDRFRDRHSVAGAKDDRLDALVLASSLQTDQALFRAISLPDAQRLELAALNRSYESLTDQVLAVSNEIRALLVRYFPQFAELGRWHEEPWLWEIFKRAPTPQKARSLSPTRVKKILKEHRIRRYEAKEILETLRETPLPVAPGVAEAASKRIALLLPVLLIAHAQRSECTRQLKSMFAAFAEETASPEQAHHDAVLLLSLPGIGVHNGAVILTEAELALQNRDYQALRRLAGAAPVSRRTGGRNKRPQVQQRQACNRRLREAVYHWACVARQRDPRARQHYGDLRSRGHSHGRAIRGVADRLLKVLCAVLKSGGKYDPERRAPQENVDRAA